MVVKKPNRYSMGILFFTSEDHLPLAIHLFKCQPHPSTLPVSIHAYLGHKKMSMQKDRVFIHITFKGKFSHKKTAAYFNWGSGLAACSILLMNLKVPCLYVLLTKDHTDPIYLHFCTSLSLNTRPHFKFETVSRDRTL